MGVSRQILGGEEIWRKKQKNLPCRDDMVAQFDSAGNDD